VSLSVSDLRQSSALRLVIEAADATRATRIASALSGPFGGRNSGLTVDRTGTTVTVSSSTYRPGQGRLADVSTFASAMSGASHDSLVAAYADVPAIAATLKLSADDAASVAPVKAAVFTTGYDGDTLVGLVRLLIP
jgi:hypothetical protein